MEVLPPCGFVNHSSLDSYRTITFLQLYLTNNNGVWTWLNVCNRSISFHQGFFEVIFHWYSSKLETILIPIVHHQHSEKIPSAVMWYHDESWRWLLQVSYETLNQGIRSESMLNEIRSSSLKIKKPSSRVYSLGGTVLMV